jgi:ClpP class serine protease
VRLLLLDHHTEADAERLATKLSSGVWTHDYPLQVEELRQLGFAVREDMPREVYDLMELYPQSSQQRPGVEFIPVPYAPRSPATPTKTDRR